MNADAPVFVYVAYGRSPTLLRELAYSVETLRREIGPDPERIAVYTDNPAVAALPVTPIDATALIRDAFWQPYRFRIKPMALADALRRFGRACVLLDTDSYIRPGFAARVAAELRRGAAMNLFVRRDPFPDGPAFETDLPHLGRYRLDRENALMLNSGLVAVTPAHLPLIEDAIVLIDRLYAGGFKRHHDIEQFAIADMLRLGGVPIALIHDVFVHYCPRWSKRFMRRRLRRRAPGARIPLGKTRVRLFKAYWNFRLAMRKARRSWRGSLWRKT